MPIRKKSDLSPYTRVARKAKQSRSQETEEEREARLAASRARNARTLASETRAERESRLKIQRLKNAFQSRKSLKKREARLKADQERHALSLESENFTERGSLLTPTLRSRKTAKYGYRLTESATPSIKTVKEEDEATHYLVKFLDSFNTPGLSANKIVLKIGNEESIGENDTIHVFCPKCNTKVPHTAAGIQQDQTKLLIAKVYHYFEQEYEELKRMYGNLDLSPLSKFRQRTALATGVSDSMLQQILEEERLREEEEKTRAHKRRRQEDSLSDETSDDSDGDAEADNDVQPPTPAQPYVATETLVVKIEQPENVNIDEPEIFVPAPLKTEPRDYDDNNEQVTTDPISLEIKTEPQEHEIPIVSQELTKPGTSKHKERKRTRTSQNTSTQQPTQGKSSTASTSRNILMEALEQSSLLDDTEFKTEEIDVHEEGFS